MDAKELRINNWFTRIHGKGHTDMQIDLDVLAQILSDDRNIAFDDFEPIPLTENWFRDFGFKELGINWEKGMYIIDEKGGTIGTYRIFFYKSNSPMREFQHVHQLQNLYFALTDKELTKS